MSQQERGQDCEDKTGREDTGGGGHGAGLLLDHAGLVPVVSIFGNLSQPRLEGPDVTDGAEDVFILVRVAVQAGRGGAGGAAGDVDRRPAPRRPGIGRNFEDDLQTSIDKAADLFLCDLTFMLWDWQLPPALRRNSRLLEVEMK